MLKAGEGYLLFEEIIAEDTDWKDENAYTVRDFNYIRSLVKQYRKNFELLKDGEVIFGSKVVELPGHTKGSIGIELDDSILVGDALKNGNEATELKARNAYYDQDKADLSIRKILAKNKIVFPGHDGPFITSNGLIKYFNKAKTKIRMFKDYNNEIILEK